jgi:hypothetical protein
LGVTEYSTSARTPPLMPEWVEAGSDDRRVESDAAARSACACMAPSSGKYFAALSR